MDAEHRIVKVGGSLFELPDLGPRLRLWLDLDAAHRTILVVGGGAAANAIRALDHAQGIGAEHAHWLAVQTLSLQSMVLAKRLTSSRVVSSLSQCKEAWTQGLAPILDPLPLLREDEKRSEPLPHSWEVTSDSIAARIALVTGAKELVLLKSCAAHGSDWDALARTGQVDAWFPHVAPLLPAIRLVNFKASRGA